jgi:hypothetical protein
LPRGPEWAGWEILNGQWEVLADGGLRARPNTRGTWIHCKARVGPDFEIRGEVEPGPGAEVSYQAGAVFGNLRRGGATYLAFRVFRDPYAASGSQLSRQFSAAGVLTKFSLRPDSNSFRVLSRAGRVSAWVNDRQVVFDWPPPKESALVPDARIGLGGYRSSNEFVVTYRRVEVRRLAASATPP